MKIKKVSTEQFAGIREKEVSFDDGINVVFGKNESGKSTIVNLISRTLFQDAKTDKRKDKEFIAGCFPGETKGSAAKSGYIHGKVVFEADDGEYIITKEWGDDPICKLSSPSGTTKNQSEINSLLKKALGYGEGIYSELLLSSQYNADISLRAILDSSEETDAKKEITEAVTKAFSESYGISAEDMEKAIDKKIEELEGKHWDRENGVPMRKAGRWASGIGEVHKAYYAFEDAKTVIEKNAELENEVFKAESLFRKSKEEKEKADNAYSAFSDFASLLENRDERRKSCSRLKSDLLKFENAAKKWPETLKTLEKAEILEKEQKNREILEKYNSAKAVYDSVLPLKEQLKAMRRPTEDDIFEAKKTDRRIESLKNSLCGINLSAAVRMFGGNNLEVTSLVTGENIYSGEENFAIKEAVSVRIPGIMEMQLAPANIDFEKTEQEILRNEVILNRILMEYSASDTEHLEKLAKDFSALENEIKAKENQLERAAGFVPFAELEKEAAEIRGEIRFAEEIENDIRGICGYEDIRSFITKNKVLIESFEKEYGTPEKLDEKIAECKDAVSGYEKSEEEAGNIPEEYLDIANPRAHLKILKDAAESTNESYISASETKTAALINLNNYSEEHPEPKDKVKEAEREFLEQKQLLGHWLHIKKIFDETRENFRSNPMHDLSESFTGYLGIISGERISSEFPDEEKLDMKIYSKNSRLDYSKLSEGTKETVSLAFRLAVLDHLFPNGGGVIVFDDPFTDMDAERTEKSCELIKECAKKHQVIFLTCNEDYKEMLKGKNINI